MNYRLKSNKYKAITSKPSGESPEKKGMWGKGLKAQSQQIQEGRGWGTGVLVEVINCGDRTTVPALW